MEKDRSLLLVIALLAALVLTMLYTSSHHQLTLDISVEHKVELHAEGLSRLQQDDPRKEVIEFFTREESSAVGARDDTLQYRNLNAQAFHQVLDKVPQSERNDVPKTSELGSDGASKQKDGRKEGDSLCYTPTALSSKVRFVPCKMEQLGPRLMPASVSVIETLILPWRTDLFPEISNGHVATVVLSDTIFMNGLYNGANVNSHRARIPSTANIEVAIYPIANLTVVFRLDLCRGVFSELWTGDGFTVEVRRYAHRQLTRLLVTEVVVNRTTSTLPITLNFTNHQGPPSEDITFTKSQPGLWMGATNEAEYLDITGTTPVTVVYSIIPPSLTVPSQNKTVYISFFTSVSVNEMDALNFYDRGVNQFLNGKLFSSHVNNWEGLWERGRFEMSGNDSMALATNAAFYYLLGALPLEEDVSWPFIGMSPGGLAHGAKGLDYNGHVFWDQDTWMFPAIAMLHSDLGRTIVGTRLRVHDTAVLYAHMSGLKGARFPWESAFTGLDVTPSVSCSTYELHVTGDSSWMMRQYLQMTNDTEFLAKDGGYQMMADIADYWVSRTVYNKTSKEYEILDVMGPDEAHFPVNNSVYTNMIAVQSMRSAQYAAKLINQTAKPEWEEVATQMKIGFDFLNEYHPEFDNYTRKTDVKQADVVMLGFPFRWPMPDYVRYNDLAYYANVTPGGPAMTWGIFAINWLRVDEKEKADEVFYRGTWNIQEPFLVWSEDASGYGAFNFLTGMGGYMQSLLFGYVGVDLNDDSMVINPQLPPSLTAMAVRHLDYMGNSLDVEYDENEMTVTLTSEQSPMTLTLADSKIMYLKVGSAVIVSRQKATIQRITN